MRRLTSINFITLIADCCCCSCNRCWSKQRGNRLTTKEKCLREGSRGLLQAAAGEDGVAHALESLLRWSSCLLAVPPAATRTRSRTMTRAVNAAEQSLPPPCAPSNTTLAAPDPQFESQIQIQALGVGTLFIVIVQASLFLPLSGRNHPLRNSPFSVNLLKTQPNLYRVFFFTGPP